MAEPLRIRAVNTAADSENKIHDDRIAAQYGFRGGLVPGVTVYGYLAAAVLNHFGDRIGNPWLSRGAMDVRFHQPIYEGDEAIVTLAAHPDTPGRVRVNIAVNGRECASAVAWLNETNENHETNATSDELASARSHPTPAPERRAPTMETLAPGTVLTPLSQPLDLAQSRISAPLDPAIMGPENAAPGNAAPGNALARFAHPAVLLALANEIFVKNYELGPWIHTASEIRNFSAVRDGEHLYTSAKVEDRFERKGHEFVVLEVVIAARMGAAAAIGIASGAVTAAQDHFRIVEKIRHTAIWRPRATSA
jgi:hypothetical protein